MRTFREHSPEGAKETQAYTMSATTAKMAALRPISLRQRAGASQKGPSEDNSTIF